MCVQHFPKKPSAFRYSGPFSLKSLGVFFPAHSFHLRVLVHFMKRKVPTVKAEAEVQGFKHKNPLLYAC